jgi:hypothetical protein
VFVDRSAVDSRELRPPELWWETAQNGGFPIIVFNRAAADIEQWRGGRNWHETCVTRAHEAVAAEVTESPQLNQGDSTMSRKGILTGAAALAALGMALVDVNNAEAGRRRCCCNANGRSGAYGTTQTTGYGPMNQAPPAPQTFDGSAPTSDGSAAPAPGYGHGTQYGPRATTNGATGAVRGGTTTVNPRAGENRQGVQTTPIQRDQSNRLQNEGAAPPAPGSADPSDSTQK